ncbi:MAG: hypothetical protein QGG64_22065, partial [Candidatus Latescibacteria bacterium]|nr:hypothetical protein [Candidatus Latescibacterota bacterium]
MAFVAHEQDVVSSEQPGEQVTLRAMGLGVLTILVNTWYMTYFAGNLVKSYFPVAVLIPFVVWIVINAGLKTIWPRIALSRTELVTILGMTWVAGNLPAVGWALHSVSLVPSPEFYASPENRLREVAIPFLPEWLFLDARFPPVRQAYLGLPDGEMIPWLLWTRAFSWWLVGILSAVMAGFFVSVLFFKQWHEKERLVFPMAQFPTALLEERPGERLPAVFKDRLFWIGFAVVAGIIGWNILGYFAISIPRITVFDEYKTKAVNLGLYYPSIYLRVQPLIIGLAYLCPSDILFSVWFYNLINIFKIGALNRTGFTVGLEGQTASAGEIAMLESHGALTLLVVWSVWVARHHLKETFLKAINSVREEDDGVPVSYRSAWIGLVLASVGVGGWLMSSGISFWIMVLQMTLMFICYFGISKYAATTGFTFLSPAGGKGFGVLMRLVGTENMSPGSIAMGTMINRNMFLGEAVRTTSLPSQPHVFRMLGDHLKRHPAIWLSIPLAFIVGYYGSAGIKIFRTYTEGGLNGHLVSWPMDHLVREIPYIEGTKVTVFDPQKWAVWLFGAALTGGLTYVRSRVAWWPFHPIAIAFPNNRYAFCVFLSWLVKV